MPKAKASDEELARLFEQHGAAETAKMLGITERNVYHRRGTIEGRIKRQLVAPGIRNARTTRSGVQHPPKLDLDITDGHVIVFSDAHYWPDIVTPAHRALVRIAKKLKPKAIIANGDVFDGAGISRHPPIGWPAAPTVEQEIATCQKRLREIQKAAADAKLIWTLGNHDGRFETRLATIAPEYAKVHGVHLRDHFPDWEPCWATWINDEVVVKHRFKGGIHGTHNNTLWSGKSMVTGHLHSLKVTPLSDYNGVRYGVDTGTLADIYGPQFTDYTEGNPVNWRSGFAVLKFIEGRLMMPQLCQVIDDESVEFLGEIIHV